MEKLDTYTWACGVLRDAVDKGTYGNITFGMQNGVVGNVKTETVQKPPVDNKRNNP